MNVRDPKFDYVLQKAIVYLVEKIARQSRNPKLVSLE